MSLFPFFLGCLIHCHVHFVACTFVTCFNKDQSINQSINHLLDRFSPWSVVYSLFFHADYVYTILYLKLSDFEPVLVVFSRRMFRLRLFSSRHILIDIQWTRQLKNWLSRNRSTALSIASSVRLVAFCHCYCLYRSCRHQACHCSTDRFSPSTLTHGWQRHVVVLKFSWKSLTQKRYLFSGQKLI